MDVRTTTSGQRAGAGSRRVTRGSHLVPTVGSSTTVDEEEMTELRAWQQAMPADAAFTHVTGARLLGLWLPSLPRDVATHVQMRSGSAVPRRPDLRMIRAGTSTAGPVVDGLRVAPASEVLLALARDLGPLDVLVALDSALHQRVLTRGQLEEALRRRRRGAPMLRALLPLADARSESPWETVLREFHRCAAAPVEPQFEIVDEDGRFVARADLRLRGTRTIHEYDGHHHLELERQRSDLRRARRLVAAGWTRRGYTSDDLLHRPEQVLHDIDLALGRAPDAGALVKWADLLQDSSLTPRGWSRLVGRLGPNTQRPARRPVSVPLPLPLPVPVPAQRPGNCGKDVEIRCEIDIIPTVAQRGGRHTISP